jgi:predicted nucleic acid-binding protein
VSGFVLDASIALRWFLTDETDREYSSTVLSSLDQNVAIVPPVFFYEVGNGLLMALRRRRVSSFQIDEYLRHLKALPIAVADETPSDVLGLVVLAQQYALTTYDASYLALAMRLAIPIATSDEVLRTAATGVGAALYKA